MAMEFNGDVYACDHWVEPEWLVGNIANSDFPTLATSEKMRAFDTKKQDLDDETVRSCVCAGVDVQRIVSLRPILGLHTITSARDTGVSILTLCPTSKRWAS